MEIEKARNIIHQYIQISPLMEWSVYDIMEDTGLPNDVIVDIMNEDKWEYAGTNIDGQTLWAPKRKKMSNKEKRELNKQMLRNVCNSHHIYVWDLWSLREKTGLSFDDINEVIDDEWECDAVGDWGYKIYSLKEQYRES